MVKEAPAKSPLLLRNPQRTPRWGVQRRAAPLLSFPDRCATTSGRPLSRCAEADAKRDRTTAAPSLRHDFRLRRGRRNSPPSCLRIHLPAECFQAATYTQLFRQVGQNELGFRCNLPIGEDDLTAGLA